MRKFVLLMLFAVIASTNCYQILLLIPFPGPSHFLMFKVFIKELISRGHHVTSISAYPFNEELTNYTEIKIEPTWSFGDGFSQEKIFDMQFNKKLDMLYSYWWMGLESTEHALKSSAVQNFIETDKTKFDLILAEQFFQESMLMFAHKYKAPIVTISTYGYSDFMDRMFGALTPYSFVPHMVLYDYDDEMSLTERAHNLAFSMFDAVMRKFYYLPAMNKQARKYFSSLPSPLPSVEELENSVSMILVNSHFGMIKPRPMMPGMVNIAGAHIKPVQPLPNDIQEFLDGAEYGAIYMSLGAFVQSSKMPKEKMETILKVFGSLKQRVLWKFETDNLPKLPPNVMVRKWLPQSDILAHPKLVLFIAHGGLFGTIEGSYRGVPILFMPFYGDQYRNAKLAESRGYAKKILFSDVTEKSLKSLINEMTSNRNYLTKAREVSSLLSDNPSKPIDEAMYWIEYVVRHNGAKHLKGAGTKLPWYKYLLLDVLGLILAILWVLWKGFQYFLSEMCPKKAERPEDTKKNN